MYSMYSVYDLTIFEDIGEFEFNIVIKNLGIWGFTVKISSSCVWFDNGSLSVGPSIYNTSQHM